MMTNDDRAERVRLAIEVYRGDDDQFYLQDLICDLGHWRDRHGIEDAADNEDLEVACYHGMEHYKAEVAAEREEAEA